MIYKFFKLQEEITKIIENGRKKINELLKINKDLEIQKEDQKTEIARLRNILEDGGARCDTTTLGRVF